MGRLRICGPTSDGTVGKDLLSAIGCSVEKDSQGVITRQLFKGLKVLKFIFKGLMNCRDIDAHTLGKNGSSVLSARRSS